MNKTTNTNWANAEHYEKAFKYLDDKSLDTTNEYLYVELLESAGLTVYVADLKKWIKSLSVQLDTKSFKL